jgi:RNA polymerase sigma factor (sigma-70 family)
MYAPYVGSSDLCADDAASFEAIYKVYRHQVYAIGKRMLEDAAAAEDIVQSVFITVWMTPGAFRGGSFAAWLTCVTKNRARDVLRARASRRETSYPLDLFVEERFEDVYTRLEMTQVHAALAELPLTQRSLIELGFLNEHSHAELVKLTGLPLGTVKTRLRAGLRALRLALILTEDFRSD